MDRKLWAVPLRERELMSPHLTQCRLAEAYLPTKWHLDPSSRLATIDIGRKFGRGCCAFPLFFLFLWGAGFSSNTMLPGPRPTSVPNSILIHPTVWPEYGPADYADAGARDFRKCVVCCALCVGELGPHVTQCGLGRGLPPRQVSL